MSEDQPKVISDITPVRVGAHVVYRNAPYTITEHRLPSERLDIPAGIAAVEYPDGVAYTLWPDGEHHTFENRNIAFVYVRRNSFTVLPDIEVESEVSPGDVAGN